MPTDKFKNWSKLELQLCNEGRVSKNASVLWTAFCFPGNDGMKHVFPPNNSIKYKPLGVPIDIIYHRLFSLFSF